jgi:hypothetical protein
MIQSLAVLSTLSAYRVVAAVSGTAGAVGYPETAYNLALGITINDVKDVNAAIPIAGPGEIAPLYFNQTVGAGQIVGFDTSGRGVAVTMGLTSTAISSAAGIIGVLIGPVIGATGGISDVYIVPTIIRVGA